MKWLILLTVLFALIPAIANAGKCTRVNGYPAGYSGTSVESGPL